MEFPKKAQKARSLFVAGLGSVHGYGQCCEGGGTPQFYPETARHKFDNSTSVIYHTCRFCAFFRKSTFSKKKKTRAQEPQKRRKAVGRPLLGLLGACFFFCLTPNSAKACRYSIRLQHACLPASSFKFFGGHVARLQNSRIFLEIAVFFKKKHAPRSPKRGVRP